MNNWIRSCNKIRKKVKSIISIIHVDKEQVDDTDERSVFVKNVDYSAEPAELKDFFKEAGEIKRVTILFDKIAN